MTAMSSNLGAKAFIQAITESEWLDVSRQQVEIKTANHSTSDAVSTNQIETGTADIAVEDAQWGNFLGLQNLSVDGTFCKALISKVSTLLVSKNQQFAFRGVMLARKLISIPRSINSSHQNGELFDEALILWTPSLLHLNAAWRLAKSQSILCIAQTFVEFMMQTRSSAALMRDVTAKLLPKWLPVMTEWARHCIENGANTLLSKIYSMLNEVVCHFPSLVKPFLTKLTNLNPSLQRQHPIESHAHLIAQCFLLEGSFQDKINPTQLISKYLSASIKSFAETTAILCELKKADDQHKLFKIAAMTAQKGTVGAARINAQWLDGLDVERQSSIDLLNRMKRMIAFVDALLKVKTSHSIAVPFILVFATVEAIFKLAGDPLNPLTLNAKLLLPQIQSYALRLLQVIFHHTILPRPFVGSLAIINHSILRIWFERPKISDFNNTKQNKDQNQQQATMHSFAYHQDIQCQMLDCLKYMLNNRSASSQWNQATQLAFSLIDLGRSQSPQKLEVGTFGSLEGTNYASTATSFLNFCLKHCSNHNTLSSIRRYLLTTLLSSGSDPATTGFEASTVSQNSTQKPSSGVNQALLNNNNNNNNNNNTIIRRLLYETLQLSIVVAHSVDVSWANAVIRMCRTKGYTEQDSATRDLSMQIGVLLVAGISGRGRFSRTEKVLDERELLRKEGEGGDDDDDDDDDDDEEEVDGMTFEDETKGKVFGEGMNVDRESHSRVEMTDSGEAAALESDHTSQTIDNKVGLVNPLDVKSSKQKANGQNVEADFGDLFTNKSNNNKRTRNDMEDNTSHETGQTESSDQQRKKAHVSNEEATDIRNATGKGNTANFARLFEKSSDAVVGSKALIAEIGKSHKIDDDKDEDGNEHMAGQTNLDDLELVDEGPDEEYT